MSAQIPAPHVTVVPAEDHACIQWDEATRDLPAELREWMTQPECNACLWEERQNRHLPATE